MEVALLGVAGAGKGFFARRLVRELGLVHLSMGELLRERAGRDPGLGDRLRRGELVDDGLCIALLSAGIARASGRGVLLDGFPRSLRQAELLEERHRFHAVEVRLDLQIATEKLLGRRQCSTCGEAFNLAHIVRGRVNMPAILPDPSRCPLGKGCSPLLTRREDDTPEVIARRLELYRREAAPVLRFFAERGRLTVFEVVRGAEDSSELVRIVRDLAG